MSSGDFSLSSHTGHASFSSFIRQYNLLLSSSSSFTSSLAPALTLMDSHECPSGCLRDCLKINSIYLKWLIAKSVCPLLWSRLHSVLSSWTRPVDLNGVCSQLRVPRHHRWSTCGCPYSCGGACDFLSVFSGIMLAQFISEMLNFSDLSDQWLSNDTKHLHTVL